MCLQYAFNICLLLVTLSFANCWARRLTNEDFDDIVGGDYFLFIKFYAPWCGHCQKLAPIWHSLEAKILSYQTSRVIIASVDCTEERELCPKEQVMGYPTLKLYKAHDKHGIEYEGERDLTSLENYLRTQLGDQVVEGKDESFNKVDTSHAQLDMPKPVNGLFELNDENFEKFVSKGNHFVKFYAPWCTHCQRLAPTWEQLAESFHFDTSVRISKIDCTLNDETCKSYQIKGYPTLLWIVDGKVIDKYSGSRSHEDLKDYITQKKKEALDSMKLGDDVDVDDVDVDDVSPLTITEQNFMNSIRDGITFIKYMVPWCTRSRQLKPIWEQLSRKLMAYKDVKIAKVDCAQHEILCNKQHIDGYPTLLLYKNSDKIGEYEGERTLEDLHSYVLSHFSSIKDEL